MSCNQGLKSYVDKHVSRSQFYKNVDENINIDAYINW